MDHACNGECPLGLYARPESPALMRYGDPVRFCSLWMCSLAPLSLMLCSDFIGRKKSESPDAIVLL